MKKIILLILLGCMLGITSLQAQGLDPGRVYVIEKNSMRSKKAVESYLKAQGLNTTGHIWCQEVVEGIMEFQREYNQYLDDFHNTLSIAAEVYGMFVEVKKLAKNISDVEQELVGSPQNAIAVAVSTNRNKIYTQVIKTSISVVMDVRKVCFEKSKMTEKERMKVIEGIRKKIRTVNKQLRQLVFALHYASFLDAFHEMHQKGWTDDEKKRTIIQKARLDWINNARLIK